MIRSLLRSTRAWVSIGILALAACHLWFIGRTDLTPTVSVVELEWTAIALAGCLYSIDFLLECRQDWRAAEDSPDERDRWVVEMVTQVGAVFLAFHLMFLALGGGSMLVATNRQPVNALLAQSFGVAFTVTGLALVLVLAGIRAKRIQIREYMPTTTVP